VKLAKYESRPCVLKIVSKEYAVKMKQVEHLWWERELLMTIENPFIVKCYGTCQDEKSVYFVQEYLSGGEIYNVVR
jgi:serine/threonine protein kinase